MSLKSAGETRRPGAASTALVKAIMEMVVQTREAELSCDESHQLLEEFAELVARGENPSGAMQSVQEHMDLCPDCKEEYEALVRILQNLG